MTVSSLSTSFYGAGVFTGMMCLPHITEWEGLVFTSRLLTRAPDASVCPPCGPPPSLRTLLCLAVTTSGRAVFLLCWGCGRNSWWLSPPSAATTPGFRLLKNDLVVLSLCMLLPPEKRSPRLGMTQNGASHPPRPVLRHQWRARLPRRCSGLFLSSSPGTLCPLPSRFHLPGTRVKRLFYPGLS